MTQLSGEINVQSLVSGDVSSRPILNVGLTDEVKQAFLAIAQKVAYIDEHGQTYYDALYNALYPPAVLLSIDAVFAQGSAVIYDSDSLDVLRQYLTVTGLFDDYTTDTIQGYSLSGTLTAGTSTITVSYGGKTTTFGVEVTHRVWAVTSIDAVFTQGDAVIYDNDSLDVLREYLTVTATYENELTAVVTSYSLSGTLTVGESTVTVSYGGQTDTFSVTVTQHVAVLTSITASFAQGSHVVYDTDTLESLKPYLTVTGAYDDGTSRTITDYTLSGTLTEGASTITVSFGGKTTGFDVMVTASVVPSEYRQVDYIYSNSTDGTNGTYVATNASFSSPTTAIYKCVAQLETGSSINGHVMCTRQKNTGSANNTGFEMIFNPTTSVISSWSSVTANYTTTDIFAKHTVVSTWEADKMTVEVDGSTPVVSSGSTRAIGGYPICILGAKPAIGDSGGNRYYFRGKVYYAEASQDGTVIMACYPCVRKSDNAPGFYDTVNNAFYTGISTGGKTIVAGND